MSNPYEQQPLAQPNTWPGQQPGSGQPPPPPYLQQPQPPQQPPPGQWPPPIPAAKPSNGLAITALVVACLALVMVLGVIVFVPLTAAFSSAGDLQGTAPQVLADESYPGELLQDEVSRVIRGDGGDVESMTCPETTVVEVDAVTICHGRVDGFDSEVKVTFDDDLGHFTLVERVASGD